MVPPKIIPPNRINFLARPVISVAAIIVLFALFCFTPQTTRAEEETSPTTSAPTTAAQPRDNFYRAKVIKILEEGSEILDGEPQVYQKIQLKILEGDEKGKLIIIDHGKGFIIGTFQKVTTGEKVIVAKPTVAPENPREIYYIVDKYRAPSLIGLGLIFFALAVFFGRKRGFTSIIGLLFTILILFYFIIPRIVAGGNPFLTCIIGAVLIIVFSLYLSHGFNRRTSVALVSTLVALGIAIIIDLIFVDVAKLLGNGTEEAFYLQFDNFNIDLRGLLLGSIIIGVVGVLDDITTAQAGAVEEIYEANPNVTFAQLYKSGLSVGREHIASLINTLILAYAGASFPLLLLYSTNSLQPLWITLNSNFISEEIVRTLVGSSVLVIAVPLTTMLAAYYFTRHRPRLLPKKILEPSNSADAINNFWKNK